MVLRKLFIVDSEVIGKGQTVFAWQKEGNYLAVTGAGRRVVIVDRQGSVVHQFSLSGTTPAIAMEWDNNGEILAIIQEKSSILSLFNMSLRRTDTIETNLKIISFLSWSRGHQLVCGSVKGQLLFYNRLTTKKNTISNAHSKKIIGGAWNRLNNLVTISEDKIVSVMGAEGTVLYQANLNGIPISVSWGESREGSTKEGNVNTVAINMGKNLVLLFTKSKNPPMEIGFNSSYGSIVAFRFFSDSCILLGMSRGYVVVISTLQSELGKELSSFKTHREVIENIAYCRTIQKGCAIGEGQVRVFEMEENNVTEQRSEKIDVEQLFSAMTHAEWTEDGQILTVGSKVGLVYSFLTRLPTLNDYCGTNLLYLSSLRELSVRSIDTESLICKIPVDIEPTFVAVGTNTAAAGMNNQISFFSFSKAGGKFLSSRTYSGIVDGVKLSSTFVAAVVEGKVVVHPIDKDSEDKQQVILPEKDDAGRVTSIAMTENFLIYATSAGNITYFSLADYKTIVDYKHNGEHIRYLASNTNGTRVAFIDSKNVGFIFNPNSEVTTQIENFSPSTRRLLWDTSEYGIIVGHDNKVFTTYVYSPNSRYGPTCEAVSYLDKNYTFSKVHHSTLPPGFQPITMYRGAVHCQTAAGSLASVSLGVFNAVFWHSKNSSEGFVNNLNLNRLQQAATLAKTPEQLNALARKALHLLDIDMCTRIYRLLNQPTLVLFLEKISHIKEKNILLGHVAMINGNFNDAQNFFTRSSRPILALEMRRDLLQWDHALHLARSLATDQVPHISREYAQQLEFNGEYAKALDIYQQGKMPQPKGHTSAELDAQINTTKAHNDVCDAGVARCMLRTGNIRGGVALATSLKSASTALECARLLEGMGQFEEAGALFEQAEQYEKAAQLYIIHTKNLKAAGRLLPKIKSRNILVLFAKAKEQQGKYAEAEEAYALADDWDNVVRIKVEYQNDLHGASIIVRKTRSAEAASMVAKMCQKKNEYGPAVEFLVMAKRLQEAFDLARNTNTMSHYEQALLGLIPIVDGSVPRHHKEDYAAIAKYYDKHDKKMQAGHYYAVAGYYAEALERFMAINTPESISSAVEVVGRARSNILTTQLTEFLKGEKDGETKDESYMIKMHMLQGDYDKAAKAAVTLSNTELQNGNYRLAHKILLDNALAIQDKATRIPSLMLRALMLIHSYLIVKHIMKPLEDADNATRMLLRVARNIQKFPQHIPTILTSVVLQCIKTEFKASAHEYSSILIQNEKYHASMNEKHKKKIETIIRKRGRTELQDPAEKLTPCPFCAAPVPETVLDCGSCKSTLPFCIVTGKHMTLEEWTACPQCKFPALYTPFIKLLKDTPQCPMCEQYVDANNIAINRNPDVKQFS